MSDIDDDGIVRDEVLLPLSYRTKDDIIIPTTFDKERLTCNYDSDDEEEEMEDEPEDDDGVQWNFESEIQWDGMDHEEEKEDDNLEMFPSLHHGLLMKKWKKVVPPGIDFKDPLFHGSPYSAQDFCRYIIALKNSNKMGDHAFAATVGSVLSFIPEENFFKTYLKKQPSVYSVLSIIDMVADVHKPLRTYKFHTCSVGSCIHKKDSNFCDCSGECRWINCSSACFDDEGQVVCSHVQEPVNCFWYMPVRDRLKCLLDSDIGKLFQYEKVRPEGVNAMSTLRFHYVFTMLCMHFVLTTISLHFYHHCVITTFSLHFPSCRWKITYTTYMTGMYIRR
jgi:hypothetical protein